MWVSFFKINLFFLKINIKKKKKKKEKKIKN